MDVILVLLKLLEFKNTFLERRARKNYSIP